MRVTIAMRAGTGAAAVAATLFLCLWTAPSFAEDAALDAASRQCRADMKVLKVHDRAPLLRCFTAKVLPVYRQKLDPALFATYDVWLSRVIEIADRFDRGLLTDAQAAVENARAAKEHADADEAYFRARDQAIERRYQERGDAIDRRYNNSPSSAWLWQDPPRRQAEPAPQPAPTVAPPVPPTIDCTVRPGSGGSRVHCW
jgi:hypothetical protein